MVVQKDCHIAKAMEDLMLLNNLGFRMVEPLLGA